MTTMNLCSNTNQDSLSDLAVTGSGLLKQH